MFTSIRKYTVRRGSVPELAQRVRDGFLPLMRQIDGFKGYYLLDGGPDVLITVSIFESADAALASNEKAAAWVRENVLEFTRGNAWTSWWDMCWSAKPGSSPRYPIIKRLTLHQGATVVSWPRKAWSPRVCGCLGRYR